MPLFYHALAFLWIQVLSFRAFYEVKSVIYNTIVLFRASIVYKFIDFSIEPVEKEHDDLDDNTQDVESD